MGYYIQTPVNKQKAQYLIEHMGATLWRDSVKNFANIPEGMVAVCVVENPLFDACGLAYSPAELEAFNQPTDIRPRTWLLMEKKMAYQEAGYK